MAGEGETPEEEGEEIDRSDLKPGVTLYMEDGTPVGDIRGVQEGSVVVSLREGVETLSVEHARSGHTFGEAELMWRCTNCGEMGEIDEGLPENCPNCGTEREDLMYWTED